MQTRVFVPVSAIVAFSLTTLLAGCSAPVAAIAERELPPAPVDGVVQIQQASRPFIQTEEVTGAKSDVPVSAPARVEFRDGALAQINAPLDGRIVTVHVQPGARVNQ